MQYTFTTDYKSKEFFDKVAELMIVLFEISHDEAVGRMNRLWNDQVFTGPDNLIYHEDVDFWAYNVFYGGDSSWWMNPPDLKPLPYP